jgi:hypothetical protein
MKIFGSWSELLSVIFRKNSQAITLRPNQATTYTASRDIQLPEGDSAHVVVSRTSTDTLTNKTLTAPSMSAADMTSYIELDHQASDAAAPSNNDVRIYAKSKKLYARTADAISEIGGGGAGEINLIDNPNDAAAGWTASGAGITVATSTTSSDLPLAGIVETSIKITPVSSTDYVRYRFTMPAALKQRKLKLEWHQRPLSGYAAGDLKVEVYKNSASDYTGSYTEFNLSTDSSGTSAIPNQTGKFTTTFDTDDGDYYEIRIVRTAGTTALNLAQVVCGPGIQPQGAIVSPTLTDLTFTPAAGFGTVANTHYSYQRLGNVMRGRLVWRNGTVAASSADVTLPTGIAIDSALMPSLSDKVIIGRWYAAKNAAGSTTDDTNSGPVFYGGSALATKLYLTNDTLSGAWTSDTVTDLMSSSDYVTVEFEIPVAAWAGTSANLAQNDVEYAYNSSTTDANDTTSFGYGPAGAVFPNFTAFRSKTVQFPTPIQPTDQIVLQYTYGTSSVWTDVGQSSFGISPLITQNSATYGIGWRWASGNNQIIVDFGAYRYPGGATYGAAGSAWSDVDNDSSYRWRVKKISGGNAVGFGNVSQNNAGLVKSAGQLLGTNTNDSAATGYVGEYLTSSRLRASAVGITTNTANNATTAITLTAGEWEIWGFVGYSFTASTSVTRLAAAISRTDGVMPASSTYAVPNASGELTGQLAWAAMVPVNDIIIPTGVSTVKLSESATFYLVAFATFTASTTDFWGSIHARRVR